MQQPADIGTTLCIRQHYTASPARVFDAWLTPRLAGCGCLRPRHASMMSVVIDARAGGTFCFVERQAGTLIEHRGRYLEIARPRRLVFVLHSPDCAPQATRVTAEFTRCDAGCKLRMMHDGLSADEATSPKRTSFGARWTGMLYGLGVVLAAQETGILL